MKEALMTVERWKDPAVKAEFYSRFTDIFKPRDTAQQDDTVDTHTLEQENQRDH